MIYVDKQLYYASRPHGFYYWAHLWSDTSEEELHEFAQRIGLKRGWFQPHRTLAHYDVTGTRYDAALAAGAKQSDIKAFLHKLLRDKIVNGASTT